MFRIIFQTDVSNTVSKLGKSCVMRLTTKEVCFHVGDDTSPIAWAVLSQKKFFSEYEMIGATDDQNEIYLEFSPAMLAKSLTSLKMTAKSVKIKLTNKTQPCLTIDIELPSISNEARQCIHDIPVKVIPRREWGEYQAPVIPPFDVGFRNSDRFKGFFPINSIFFFFMVFADIHRNAGA